MSIRVLSKSVDVILRVSKTKKSATAFLEFRNGMDELIDADYIQVRINCGRLIMKPGEQGNGHKLNRENHKLYISSKPLIEELYNSGMAGHYPLKIQEADGKVQSFYIDKNDRFTKKQTYTKKEVVGKKKKVAETKTPAVPVASTNPVTPMPTEAVPEQAKPAPGRLILQSVPASPAGRTDEHAREALLCFLDIAEGAINAGDITRARNAFRLIRDMVANDFI